MRRLIVSGMVLALAGCGGGDVRQALGIDRTAPDEFQVVTRAPLSVPPTYDLRPPRPGALRPQESTTRSMAEAAVIGGTNASPIPPGASGSLAENILLQQAKATGATPNIRAQLDAENEARRKAAELPIDAVLPPSDKTNDRLVDPDAEAKRVRTAKDKKQPVTGAGTATAEPEKPNLWQRIGDIF
jgi:hypothetical protein